MQGTSFLGQILMKHESLGGFSKNPKISNFMKIRPVGAEFCADGQSEWRTDMTKPTVTFLCISNPPQNLTRRSFSCV
jgi:hypothetical protein